MKNRFKKTIIVLVMTLMGMCFAAEPGQKLLGKVKTTDYVVTQECDNVFTTWLNAYDWNQYLKTESDPTVPAWAKVENPPYLTTYTETDPFFSSWIGNSTITFSNQIIKFQTDKSNFYIDGQTFGWWLNWAVAPVQTDLDTFKTSTNGKLNILTEDFNDLSTRYAGSVREIERLSGNLNSFNDLISEMNRDVGGFRADLLFFKMTLRDFQTYVTNNIESLNTSNAELSAKVDGLNTSLDEFKNETTNNIARLDSADEALGVRIDNANTALNQRIDDTNASMDTFKMETTNAIARLDTKDSETTGNLENLSNQVAKVESDLSFTSNRVEEIYGDYVKLSDLQAGITFDTMNVTNLTVNGEHVSLESHKHDDKLDATNGVAYGLLYVLPEEVPGGLVGNGHALLDNESLRFTTTTTAPDITYGLNGISALYGADNEQWYEFNNSANGIARLKDIDSATSAKLNSTNGTAYGKITVKSIGTEQDFSATIDNNGLQLFDPSNNSLAFYGGEGIITGDDQYYMFYPGDTGIARMKDINTAMTNLVYAGGKSVDPMATFVNAETGWNFNGLADGINLWQEDEDTEAILLNNNVFVRNIYTGEIVSNEPIDRLAFQSDIEHNVNSLELGQESENTDLRFGIQWDIEDTKPRMGIFEFNFETKEIVSNRETVVWMSDLNEYVKLSDLEEGINIKFNTMEVTNLTVNGQPVSLKGHTHELWEIPGAEAAATNAIQKINSATELRQVQDAMIEFLQNFKKPE